MWYCPHCICVLWPMDVITLMSYSKTSFFFLFLLFFACSLAIIVINWLINSMQWFTIQSLWSFFRNITTKMVFFCFSFLLRIRFAKFDNRQIHCTFLQSFYWELYQWKHLAQKTGGEIYCIHNWFESNICRIAIDIAIEIQNFLKKK